MGKLKQMTIDTTPYELDNKEYAALVLASDRKDRLTHKDIDLFFTDCQIATADALLAKLDIELTLEDK